MSFRIESSRIISSAPKNVTSITVDQGARSQNLTPRQRTIEMTQFAACIVRSGASTGPGTAKKAEQGIDDVLKFEEIEQPEDGR